MDEDEDGRQFAPGQRQNSVQKAGLFSSFIGGIAFIPIGVVFIVVLLAMHRSPLFGILVVVVAILITVFARSVNRGQNRK